MGTMPFPVRPFGLGWGSWGQGGWYLWAKLMVDQQAGTAEHHQASGDRRDPLQAASMPAVTKWPLCAASWPLGLHAGSHNHPVPARDSRGSAVGDPHSHWLCTEALKGLQALFWEFLHACTVTERRHQEP